MTKTEQHFLIQKDKENLPKERSVEQEGMWYFSDSSVSFCV